MGQREIARMIIDRLRPHICRSIGSGHKTQGVMLTLKRNALPLIVIQDNGILRSPSRRRVVL